MKKLIVFVFTAICFIAASKTASAQYKVGGGLSLGSEMSVDDDGDDKAALGLSFRGLYEYNQKLDFVGTFNYFFPSAPSGLDVNACSLDADVHYKFFTDEELAVYGIGGLNYSYAKVEVDSGLLGHLEDSDSEIGLDLGAGIQITRKQTFYGEVKYNTAFENIIVSVGVLFDI